MTNQQNKRYLAGIKVRPSPPPRVVQRLGLLICSTGFPTGGVCGDPTFIQGGVGYIVALCCTQQYQATHRYVRASGMAILGTQRYFCSSSSDRGSICSSSNSGSSRNRRLVRLVWTFIPGGFNNMTSGPHGGSTGSIEKVISQKDV